MPEFSIDRPLPSVLVTKALLKSLEDYVSDRLANLAQLTDRNLLKRSIVVVDSYGEETFTSIDEMHPTKFPDTTSRITVNFETPWNAQGSRGECRLSFAKGRLFSMASVEVRDSNARELATGLVQGLFRVLEPHETRHWFFQPNPAVSVVLWALLLGTPWLLNWIATPWPLTLLAPVLWLILFLYLYLGKPLHPYSTFDSGKWDRTSKLTQWFIYGSLTFLVFGTLFAFLRTRLFGF